ncbi:hypothetical protein BOTCAL_0314g00010 [Botryotinia calthae]|uniref:Uncharacterized protein n=1 Tax=Botryotinia calthae TaxID=38488 RepID=A0A4Y8CW59_9HELO|nr:hypothetical protein BOTCAL_0314g00010 [Botryotinia calthae]
MPEVRLLGPDYEEIDYKVCGAVDYDRAMSWESGDSSGRIAIGTGQNISTIHGADIGKSNIDLPVGWLVLVTKAKFRLSISSSPVSKSSLTARASRAIPSSTDVIAF